MHDSCMSDMDVLLSRCLSPPSLQPECFSFKHGTHFWSHPLDGKEKTAFLSRKCHVFFCMLATLFEHLATRILGLCPWKLKKCIFLEKIHFFPCCHLDSVNFWEIWQHALLSPFHMHFWNCDFRMHVGTCIFPSGTCHVGFMVPCLDGKL